MPEPSRSLDRRRILGLVLLVIAVFILLPEFKTSDLNQELQDDFQVKPIQIQALPAKPAVFEQLDEVKAQPVPVMNVAQFEKSVENWSDNYQYAVKTPVNSESKVQAVIAKPVVRPSFIVQMGSFGNPVNASTLELKLRAEGYRAFTQHNDQYYRVVVGPQLRKQEAKLAQTSLARDLKIQGVIKTYRP